MVIFENDDFFIVNKKEKVPMHKGTGHKYGLAEVFKKIYKSDNINFANRLDFETSGLVIGCKTLKFLRYFLKKLGIMKFTKNILRLFIIKILLDVINLREKNLIWKILKLKII